MKNIVKVSNMYSSNNKPVADQFILYANDATFFQSYQTIIAMTKNGKIYLDAANWDYSRTTGKYRNIFLGMDKKETENAIKDGRIELVNLNPDK